MYVVINDKSQIIAIKITEGNVDDRKAFEFIALAKDLQGKCYADKGYLSKDLFTHLYKKGLVLIIGIKLNMQNYLIPIYNGGFWFSLNPICLIFTNYS